MYELRLRDCVEKAFFKLARNEPKQLEIIHRKIVKIREDPHRFKNLRKPLQHLKRVHIDKSHVLVFSIVEPRKTIIVEAYDHHDRIYRE